MENVKAIILAAGKGVRMKSNIPKVLHLVCHKPMIQYVVDVVRSLRIKDISVIVGHKSDKLKKYLGKSVLTIVQKKLLGTADAVKITASHFRNYRGDILIVCGDTPLLKKETIKRLISKHKRTKASCTFLTAIMDNSRGYGRIVRDLKDKVIAIREEKDATGREKEIKEINTGVYCFKAKDLFRFICKIKMNPKKKEFYLTDIIEILIREKLRIETVLAEFSYEGLGINTRAGLAFAEDVLRKEILADFMEKGVTIVDPSTTFIGTDVRIGHDTTIRPFTVIEQNVHIGKRCFIGPFCHIRPESHIDDDVQIGNFTEVSRSKVGNRTFMKHFSFLGDARVGQRVNIGAGVVTANYDGKKKNITQISDDAFIGSDSILVAPLKVGRKAVTGAGCVVPKKRSVPSYSVVVGIPARILSRRKNK